MPFFVLGMMGAADVKVFAVLGAWCGMPALVDLWIVASIVALVHSFVMLTIVRNRSHTVTERFGDGVTSGSSGLSGTSALSGVSGKRRGAPYAAFLTVPALVWLAIQMTPGGLQ
jgi:prepilin peptidase CpaA